MKHSDHHLPGVYQVLWILFVALFIFLGLAHAIQPLAKTQYTTSQVSRDHELIQLAQLLNAPVTDIQAHLLKVKSKRIESDLASRMAVIKQA